MKRGPLNPFKYDGTRPIHRVTCLWEEIDEEDRRVAIRVLARFRRENPDVESVPANQMVWGYAWTEDGQPLDLSLSTSIRAGLRGTAIWTRAIFCRKSEREAYSPRLDYLPDAVVDAIIAEEDARPTMSEAARG